MEMSENKARETGRGQITKGLRCLSKKEATARFQAGEPPGASTSDMTFSHIRREAQHRDLCSSMVPPILVPSCYPFLLLGSGEYVCDPNPARACDSFGLASPGCLSKFPKCSLEMSWENQPSSLPG